MKKIILSGAIFLSLFGCANFINNDILKKEDINEKFTKKCINEGYKKDDPKFIECIEKSYTEYIIGTNEKARKEVLYNDFWDIK